MKTIAIYNNKGGVGKSTVTLFLADYFSSLKMGGKEARILVLDLDGQGSSAIALLGAQRVASAKEEGKCFPQLLQALRGGAKVQLSNYLHVREKACPKTRSIPLGKLWVIPSQRAGTIAIESTWEIGGILTVLSHLKFFLAKNFDMVFIDLPANIDERNRLALASLLIADHILIPVEPSRITLNALLDTFSIIEQARALGYSKPGKPDIVGILLNKTDKRVKQYKLHHQELFATAAAHKTTVLSNFLPSAPALATASDDSLEFATLKEKYSTYYDHVRQVAMELGAKCGYEIKRKAQ